MSFLEMLDVVNERLIKKGEEPIAFDHDCREGICGQCGVVINGDAHGPRRATTTCQLHMRSFKDGDVLTIEPWRAASFPVMKDLMVDRSAFDRIIAAGRVRLGPDRERPRGQRHPRAQGRRRAGHGRRRLHRLRRLRRRLPERLGHALRLGQGRAPQHLPQGEPEKHRRVTSMIDQMDEEGFGSCTNHGECEAVCPKEIRMEFIARMNRDYFKATLKQRQVPKPTI